MELGKLHTGLSYESYAFEEGLRSSDLKLLKKSPAHFKAATRKVSPAMNLGKAVHGFLEQGPSFMDKYLVEPIFVGKTKDGRDSTQSKEARDKKKEWYASLSPEITVLDSDQHEQLIGILDSIGKHEFLKKMLKGGTRESSLWVKDPETDLILKCRPDFIAAEGYMVDFKTTRDARRHFFSGEIFNAYNDQRPFYILQAAHYAYCAKLAGLSRPDSFTFVAIESSKPFGIKIYPMDHACIEAGNKWREPLTKLYKECLVKNEWPCYKQEAEEIQIPENFYEPGVF